jgi:hypothetical protein
VKLWKQSQAHDSSAKNVQGVAYYYQRDHRTGLQRWWKVSDSNTSDANWRVKVAITTLGDVSHVPCHVFDTVRVSESVYPTSLQRTRRAAGNELRGHKEDGLSVDLQQMKESCVRFLFEIQRVEDLRQELDKSIGLGQRKLHLHDLLAIEDSTTLVHALVKIRCLLQVSEHHAEAAVVTWPAAEVVMATIMLPTAEDPWHLDR